MSDKKDYLIKYRRDNPEYMKHYYIENKEKFKSKVLCETCKHLYPYCNKTHHIKSKKHLKAFNNNM